MVAQAIYINHGIYTRLWVLLKNRGVPQGIKQDNEHTLGVGVSGFIPSDVANFDLMSL